GSGSSTALSGCWQAPYASRTKPGCTNSRSGSRASRPDSATATVLKQPRSPTFGMTLSERCPLLWLTSGFDASLAGVAAVVIAGVRRTGGISTCRRAESERHDEHSEQDAKGARHRTSTRAWEGEKPCCRRGKGAHCDQWRKGVCAT